MGVVSECCCKEVYYRYPHNNYYFPLLFFWQHHPYFFVHFLNVFSFFTYNKVVECNPLPSS